MTAGLLVISGSPVSPAMKKIFSECFPVCGAHLIIVKVCSFDHTVFFHSEVLIPFEVKPFYSGCSYRGHPCVVQFC